MMSISIQYLQINTVHTHTLSDITYYSTLIKNFDTLTDQMFSTRKALDRKASAAVNIKQYMTEDDFNF